MIPIAPPDIGPGDVFAASLTRMKASELRTRLTSSADEILAFGALYTDQATRRSLHEVHPTLASCANVSSEEMRTHYRARVAHPDGPGRTFYDRILASAALERCPYCAERRVAEVDHFLPSGHYTAGTVVPVNLVPACHECNQAKRDYIAKSADTTLIHPYFDSLPAHWLAGELLHETPPAMSYRIGNIDDHTLRARAEFQFERLGIATFYATKAGQRLNEVSMSCSRVYLSRGAHAAREFLGDMAIGADVQPSRPWLSTMFEAVLTDPWYLGTYVHDRAIAIRDS